MVSLLEYRIEIYIVGTQMVRICATIHLNPQNKCFDWDVRRYAYSNTLSFLTIGAGQKCRVFFMIFVVCWFIWNSLFQKYSIKNTIRVSNSLHPDQARQFVGPDLGPNWLQRSPAVYTSGLIVTILSQTSLFSMYASVVWGIFISKLFFRCLLKNDMFFNLSITSILIHECQFHNKNILRTPLWLSPDLAVSLSWGLSERKIITNFELRNWAESGENR